MLKYIGALLVGFVATVLLAPRMIPTLKRLKFGQTIYALGPKSHLAKQGTPTMGGLVFVITVTITALVFHPVSWQGVSDYLWPLLLISLGNMLVGFADDFIIVVKKRSLGLNALQKIIAQFVIATLFTVYCFFHPQIGSRINVPFTAIQWDLGIFYIPIMVLFIVFMTNSTNLLDGVDGILASVSSVGNIGFGFISLFIMVPLLQEGQLSLGGNLSVVGVYAFALAGGCLGFLRVNYYPAKVFMGDTGSMFIGGAMVGMAMLLKQPLLLIFLAFPMIISSVSVIIQRAYFKITHGKRIFKMSPIHHHFELSGFTETQIVAMYTVVAVLLTTVALLGMMGR
ncbi:MAG: phospho-N-acetylmuramoyl-pentapeptide-transferase [Clostridiales bacterium]|nr:phospho-N-acetylmuramoyl-pentapeptide-transferase [Clostridiales bacterium]